MATPRDLAATPRKVKADLRGARRVWIDRLVAALRKLGGLLVVVDAMVGAGVSTADRDTPVCADNDERRDRVEVLGCSIDRLDMAQSVARCKAIVARRAFAQQVSINAAKLVTLQRDSRLRDVVNRCELVNADGQAIVWASRLLGDPLPERVAGIDLMYELIALAEREGYGIYILGARSEVLDLAVERLRQRHPKLRIAGHHHGWFAEEESPRIAAAIRGSDAQILFVAMSSPRKEHWLGTYGPALNVPLVMGVGGSIDIIAGVTRRAPRSWQRLGIEWLYRLLQEPRRMLRRYLITNAQFSLLLARALATRLRSALGAE